MERDDSRAIRRIAKAVCIDQGRGPCWALRETDTDTGYLQVSGRLYTWPNLKACVDWALAAGFDVVEVPPQVLYGGRDGQ